MYSFLAEEQTHGMGVASGAESAVFKLLLQTVQFSMYTMKPLRYFVPSDDIPLALTERQPCRCVMSGDEETEREELSAECACCHLGRGSYLLIPCQSMTTFDCVYCNAAHGFCKIWWKRCFLFCLGINV